MRKAESKSIIEEIPITWAHIMEKVEYQERIKCLELRLKSKVNQNLLLKIFIPGKEECFLKMKKTGIKFDALNDGIINKKKNER